MVSGCDEVFPKYSRSKMDFSMINHQSLSPMKDNAPYVAKLDRNIGLTRTGKMAEFQLE